MLLPTAVLSAAPATTKARNTQALVDTLGARLHPSAQSCGLHLHLRLPYRRRRGSTTWGVDFYSISQNGLHVASAAAISE